MRRCPPRSREEWHFCNNCQPFQLTLLSHVEIRERSKGRRRRTHKQPKSSFERGSVPQKPSKMNAVPGGLWELKEFEVLWVFKKRGQAPPQSLHSSTEQWVTALQLVGHAGSLRSITQSIGSELGQQPRGLWLQNRRSSLLCSPGSFWHSVTCWNRGYVQIHREKGNKKIFPSQVFTFIPRNTIEETEKTCNVQQWLAIVCWQVDELVSKQYGRPRMSNSFSFL